MSEQDPKEVAKEYFDVEEIVFASEPDRLPSAAHAACDEGGDEIDSDVELADDDDEPEHGDQIDGNLSGADQ